LGREQHFLSRLAMKISLVSTPSTMICSFEVMAVPHEADQDRKQAGDQTRNRTRTREAQQASGRPRNATL
jgi:hypothetical protein